jgi:hypothetical protein
MERRPLLGVLAILGACALVVALQWHASRAQRRAILALPPSERIALLQRTLRNVQALCNDPTLESQCEAEARLALILPECDPACRAMAAGHLPQATR